MAREVAAPRLSFLFAWLFHGHRIRDAVRGAGLRGGWGVRGDKALRQADRALECLGIKARVENEGEQARANLDWTPVRIVAVGPTPPR